MESKLNKYQKEAVEHLDGPCLVTSCPGSGKTFTLVERVLWLIERGVQPRNILVLTFTNKAANEMKERICKRLDNKKPGFFVGTFHSLCSKLIRKLGSSQGYSPRFNILDEKDQVDLIMQVARKLEYKIEYGDARRIANRLNRYRDQMEDFSWLEDSLKVGPLVEIAQEYLKKCKSDNLIDFSGLIYDAIKIIENDEEIKNKVQNTFKYIMVDETQDTNKAQFYLVNLLGDKWKNIVLIGDIDQSIYGWRGARYQNIQDFIDNYKDCKVISLSKNYRSTPQIIKIASKLIKCNSSHMDTMFETDNSDGEKVRCYVFNDQLEEAAWVGRTAKRLIHEGGWDPKDMAVLYRVNKMSEPIEQSMVNNGIPYEVIGSWNFFDRKEIRDCIAMLKFLSNPKDGIAFSRVCSLMKGLGNITVGKIEKLSSQKDISIPDACGEMAKNIKSIKIQKACYKINEVYKYNWDLSNPAECLKKLVHEFNYRNYLLDKFAGTATEREDNISQLIDSAGEFIDEDDGVSQYLQRISLVTKSDKEKEGNNMSLMSLHAAKGLEFPIVFVIGVEEDILPHKNAVLDDPYAGMEEERRLCYVGMTRAKKLLFTSWCRYRRRFGKHGNMSRNKSRASRFLVESGLATKE